jgi:hypothetical protein
MELSEAPHHVILQDALRGRCTAASARGLLLRPQIRIPQQFVFEHTESLCL